MQLIIHLINRINHFRYDGRPYGRAHALELRRQLRKAWKQFPNPPDQDQLLELPGIFFMLQDVSHSLMDARVSPRQLAPEISNFKEILHWIHYESRKEVMAGNLSWSDFGVENEIRFGVCLLEWEAFHIMLMFNERSAFEWAGRRRRANRALS